MVTNPVITLPTTTPIKPQIALSIAFDGKMAALDSAKRSDNRRLAHDQFVRSTLLALQDGVADGQHPPWKRKLYSLTVHRASIQRIAGSSCGAVLSRPKLL